MSAQELYFSLSIKFRTLLRLLSCLMSQHKAANIKTHETLKLTASHFNFPHIINPVLVGVAVSSTAVLHFYRHTELYHIMDH